MTAVLLLARRDLARRGRSALAMVLLVGLVGAIVIASAAGAHRSSTSLARFIAYSRASDAEIDVTNPTAAQLQAFGRVPAVADFAVLHVFALVVQGRPNLANAATIDGKLGTAVDRARLVAGRFANPGAPNEIAIGEDLAAQQHLGIGGELVAGSITPAQFALTVQGKNPGNPAGPTIRLRIVGIYRRPLDLGDLAASGGVVIETPAFDHAYTGRVAMWTTILRVRARAGAADVPRVTAAAHEIFGSAITSVKDVRSEARGGQDAINVLTLALWVFAAVAGLAGAVAIAIVLSRDVSQGEIDQPTLSAIGLTRRQCLAALGLRVLFIGIGGVIVAVVAAIAASPLFPIGIARRADPAPGVRIDLPVLGIGVLVVAAFVALVGLLAANRATLAASASAASRTRRPRRTIAELAARAGLRPAATNGLRMALEPGYGPRAVPVRSAFLGAVFGVAGLTAVLVFSASLGHLDRTPRLYGFTWDFKAPDDTYLPKCNGADFGLRGIPGVGSVAAVCYQDGVAVDGRPTTAWGFFPVRGTIDPEVVNGRAPSGPREVALGSATMRALHRKIGDTVEVRGTKSTYAYRIVGQIVLPQMQDGNVQPLADGAVFTGEGFAPIGDSNSATRWLLADFAPGADRAAVESRVGGIAEFNANAEAQEFAQVHGASGASRPPEVQRLGGIDWFPPILAVLITVLALVAVAHALVTTAHRRRRELAVLKALGFERGQVRATLAWQATALATVGVVVGIPVGVLVGNLVWRHVATGLGISAVVVVPAIALAFTVPCAIALLNLVGFWPARRAARTWPAAALTVE